MPKAQTEESKNKNNGGRPTKYNTSLCKKLIEFYDIDPWYDRPLEHYDKDGNVKWTDYKRTANKLPTVRNFCKENKITTDTFYRWVKKYKEFSDAFTQAQDLVKWFLIENGLNGCYNPVFAKFVAINITDMKNDNIELPEGSQIIPVIIKRGTKDKTTTKKQGDNPTS